MAGTTGLFRSQRVIGTALCAPDAKGSVGYALIAGGLGHDATTKADLVQGGAPFTKVVARGRRLRLQAQPPHGSSTDAAATTGEGRMSRRKRWVPTSCRCSHPPAANHRIGTFAEDDASLTTRIRDAPDTPDTTPSRGRSRPARLPLRHGDPAVGAGRRFGTPHPGAAARPPPSVRPAPHRQREHRRTRPSPSPDLRPTARRLSVLPPRLPHQTVSHGAPRGPAGHPPCQCAADGRSGRVGRFSRVCCARRVTRSDPDGASRQ